MYFDFQTGETSSCRGDSGAPLVKEFLTASGLTFKYLIGILHGSRANCNQVTSRYPGVYANLGSEEIFDFVQKWKSIESIFSEERTNDEFVELLKLMTHVDPVNQNGIKLSDFLTKSRYDSIIKVLCGKYRFNRFQQRHSNLHCSEGN